MAVMKNINFTVIMPIYNKKPHIQRAVSSVLNQSFSKFELILIDDASTDGSLEVVKQFNDDRIRLFKRDEPGPGGYAARNLGIENARADWIAFLDADDEWCPDYLDNMVNLSKKYPNASVLASAWFIAWDEMSVLNPYAKNKRGDRCFDTSEYLKVHIKGDDLIHTNVVIITKAMFQQAGGFPECSESCKRAGDGQTWLRVVLNGAVTAWSAAPGAIYYQNAVNMVTKAKKYEIDENCLITYIESCLGEDRYPEYSSLLRSYRNNRVASALFQKLKDGEVSVDHLRMAFRCFSWDLRIAAVVFGFFWPRVGIKLFNLKTTIKGPA